MSRSYPSPAEKTSDSLRNDGDLSDACVLMFSGGRDSSIAALKLAEKFHSLLLVTVAAEHLVGMNNVEERISELERDGRIKIARWLVVRQPKLRLGELNERSCLPCQAAYVATAAILALKFGIRNVAFGYTRYQDDWPEQSKEAISLLERIFESLHLTLHLPVRHIASKRDAQDILSRNHLTSNPLEQKCLKQITNIPLQTSILQAQLAAWDLTIRSNLESAMPEVEILSDRHLRQRIAQ